VLVENCRVESDDDAMALKSGTPEILIENVTVKNSTFVSRVCGFKIGPQTFGGFKNIHITGCRFEGATKPPGTKYDPQHGVFLNIGNGGFLDGVAIENCTMSNVPSALSVFLGRIDSSYWKTYWPDKPEKAEWGSIKNITAAYTFDDPSGTYDIRITYFDEEVGHSPVQLFVAGKEVLSFELDEDVDCWRWRRFENIKVNKGDEIKLVAEADRKECVRLDFVEFIPAEK